VYRTAAGYESARHEAQRLEGSAIAAKLVDAATARDLEPGLAADVVGGIFYPDDAHLIPDRFVRGLARVIEGRGVALRPGTEVLGFQTAGSRVVAVETTRGAVAADTVVVAAGSWAPGVGRTLGLRVPIQPAKGYSLTYARPADAGPRLPLLAGESRFAITPMREHVRFAGTLELAGLDFSIDRRRVDAIRRAAARYLTGLEALPLREIWRGLRPCTPDGLPLLGRPARRPNVVLATGHAMIGVSLGPITGKLVAQLVTGAAPEVNFALLDPDRFA
jgi:D-amino-acid dehydrogenase